MVRDADLPPDLDSVRRLWLDYLSWGNDGLETRYGFRLPVQEAVEYDIATVAKFQPPDGRLLLACSRAEAIGTACMRRTRAGSAEIKRMYVQPSHRGAGLGHALLDRIVASARIASYERIRLDSPDFMTTAHRLNRAAGFVHIAPYAESEIPDEYKSHWVFMELTLD